MIAALIKRGNWDTQTDRLAQREAECEAAGRSSASHGGRPQRTQP